MNYWTTLKYICFWSFYTLLSSWALPFYSSILFYPHNGQSEHKPGSIGSGRWRMLFWPEMIHRIISPHWVLVSRGLLSRDSGWVVWHWSCLIKHSKDKALWPEPGDQDVQQTLLESSSPQGSHHHKPQMPLNIGSEETICCGSQASSANQRFHSHEG